MKKTEVLKILLPLSVLIVTIFCIRHGVVLSKMPDLAQEPVALLLFYAISLFTFGANDLGAPIGGPWTLQLIIWVIYFVAPLITFIAMADILSVIRPVFLRYVLTCRPYYLVIGFGRVGQSALEALESRFGKNAYVIILDRHVDETENSISIVFKNHIFLRREIHDRDSWLPFLSSHCQGVFLLTDLELLNVRVDYELNELIESGRGFAPGFFVITRIRSLELIPFSEKMRLAVIPQGTPVRHHFVNIHVATPQLLFLPAGEREMFRIRKDRIARHYAAEEMKFRDWMAKPYDCFVFIGFGSFSSCLLWLLVEHGILSASASILIIDPLARKNWESLVLEKPLLHKMTPFFYEHALESMAEHAAESIRGFLGSRALCVFATNDEMKNIFSASYFNRKFASTTSVFTIIRTKRMDVAQPGVLDLLIGKEQWILVPTYTWAKLYFESILTEKEDSNQEGDSA